MADKRKAILVRLPAELWERLNRWAADELRSVNAQIEYVLREATNKRFGTERESPSENSPGSSTDRTPPNAD